ncbi:MAG: cyclic pyranopterin monophosphate synthase MoaC [Gemmatimonadota bacterium]|nr:cyclic pyranopterin monophosphate synthase MoaC [Gemmatimonadota bacterium]
MTTLSHLDAEGRARMVDVSGKPETARRATAEGTIILSPAACEGIRAHAGPKGEVLATAELAGVMGAKRTAELIPLCHPIGLEHVEVRAMLDDTLPGVRVRATARAMGRTGVEMEALTAAAVALLTVYDMVKAAGPEFRIGDIVLVEKSGGKHGDWKRSETDG